MRGADRLQRTVDSLKKRFAKGGVVLLYHRIAELESDPQMLAVSPKNFADHLEHIRCVSRPISLLNLATNQAEPAQWKVAVTFDDGYADNLHAAKPLLERYDIPATVFVSTAYILNQSEFWWDEVEHLLLACPSVPQTFTLQINSEHHQWTDVPGKRSEVYGNLLQILRVMEPKQRDSALETIRQSFGRKKSCRDSHRPMTASEVHDLAKGGLVEIGSHTFAHPVLSSLNSTEQRRQIHKGKETLEELLGHSVSSFSYPFGNRLDYDGHSVAEVRKAGFRLACSNFEGVVWPGTNRYQLPRMLVRNWTGDEFVSRLNAWLS